MLTSTPALRAWATMAKFLGDPAAHGLEANDTATLARVLSAAARKATGGVIVPLGTPLGGPRAAQKQREEVAQARDDLARTLGPALPALLTRFAADVVVTTELADLVPCMNLNKAAARSSLKALADALAVAYQRQVMMRTCLYASHALWHRSTLTPRPRWPWPGVTR
jgi:prophage DNA circulation protein